MATFFSVLKAKVHDLELGPLGIHAPQVIKMFLYMIIHVSRKC
jgi:hypothetical protein